MSCVSSRFSALAAPRPEREPRRRDRLAVGEAPGLRVDHVADRLPDPADLEPASDQPVHDGAKPVAPLPRPAYGCDRAVGAADVPLRVVVDHLAAVDVALPETVA